RGKYFRKIVSRPFGPSDVGKPESLCDIVLIIVVIKMKKTEKDNLPNKKPTLLYIYRRMLRPRFIIPILIMYASTLFLLTEIYGKEILVNEFVLKHGTKITLTLVAFISMGFLISAIYSLIKSERNFYDVDLNAKIETNEKLKEILNLEIEKVKKLQNISPPNTEREITQESLNGNVGKSRRNLLFEGVLEGF
ncbi:hypothetical protein CH379_019525, partial [Leptospira ellisii]|nr:hypothetical protein [Leptospira ellisii]